MKGEIDHMMDTSLYDVVSEGKLQRVREIVHLSEISCAEKWSEGYDLLLIALWKYDNYRDLAKLLLLNGSKVNRNILLRTITPLHYAAPFGDVEIVEMLLDRTAKIAAEYECRQTPLLHAIEVNHIEIVKLLLKKGACVNIRNQDGVMALHVASRKNYSEIVVTLLNYGAYINSITYIASKESSHTALHYAVENGNLQIVKLLLKNNANMDIEAVCGTSLHIATEKGYRQIVKHLLTSGANVNSVCSSTGWTALHVASARDNIEIVRLLLIEGADVNAVAKDNLMPLHVATKGKRRAIVKLLLEHGADIDAQNKDGKTILYLAVETGSSVIIKDILKFSPDVSNEGHRRAFKCAISYAERCREIIYKLLEYGFTVNSEDINNCGLLHGAVRTGNLKIVKKLLQFGADVNFKFECIGGGTLLHVATFYWQAEMAKLLINYGADVNATDEIGKSPIFYAVQNYNWTITKLLLNNGANMTLNSNILINSDRHGCVKFVTNLAQYISDTDINASDRYGIKRVITKMLLKKIHNKILETTALHVAAYKGHEKFVNILLKYGDEVDSRDTYNWTPLHIAAKMSHRGIVETLINFGACIDSKDNNGMTALHVACQERHMYVVEALLENGSDINIMSKDNLTALDCVFSDPSSCLHNRLYSYSEYVFPFTKTLYPWGCDTGTAEMLIRHLVKMKAENLLVTEKYLQKIDSNFDLKHYYSSCQKEIIQMRNDKIGNTNISFYDILTKGALQLAKYARNERVVDTLKSDDYIAMFPIYWHTIDNQFEKGQERNSLSKFSVRSFHSLLGYELPHLLTTQIFSYLSNLDLKNLIDACPDENGDEGYSSVRCKRRNFKL